MSVTLSSDRGLFQPVNSSDSGNWGLDLITMISQVDAILGGTITAQSSTVGTNFTPTSSQAQSARLLINNTSSSPFQLNLPSSNFATGNFVVTYNSSQSQGLTITAGSSGTGGTNVSMNANTQRIVFADGVNILFPDAVSPFPMQVAVEFGFDGGGSALSTGVSSGIFPGITMPFNFTVSSWTLISWDSSNANYTFDIFKSSYPGNSFASVTGSSQPNMSNSNSNQSSALTGWTTTWNSGDLVYPKLTSPSSVGTRATLSITGNRLN